MKKRTCAGILLAFLLTGALFAVALAAPLLPQPVNPPVVTEPNWNSQETRALAKTACFDCHSNETVWPWYSRTLAISWLLKNDVQEGRERLNFSDWNAATRREGGEQRERGELGELGEVVLEGEMPPFQYLFMHPEARLTPSEKATLADGLNQLIR